MDSVPTTEKGIHFVVGFIAVLGTFLLFEFTTIQAGLAKHDERIHSTEQALAGEIASVSAMAVDVAKSASIETRLRELELRFAKLEARSSGR